MTPCAERQRPFSRAARLLAMVWVVAPLLAPAQLDTDSLWAVWSDADAPDTARAKALMTYNNQVHLYRNADSALALAEQVLSFVEERGTRKYLGDAHNQVGQCLLTLGRPEEAIARFERSIQYHRDMGELKGAAGASINLGIVLANLGRTDEAIASYRSGIALCDSIGEVEFELNGLNNLGVLYLDRGEYDKAIGVFEEVVAVAAKELPGTDAHKGGLVNLGYALGRQGDHVQAIDRLNDCLRLIERHGGGQVAIYAYNFLGSSYLELGETENAEKYFWKSYLAADSLGDDGAKANPLANIAQIHKERGDRAKAYELYQEAYALLLSSGHPAGALDPLGHLARMDLEDGRIDSAEARFARGLALSEQFGNLDARAYALGGLGGVALERKAYDKAIGYLMQARRIGLDIGQPDIIQYAALDLFKAHKAMGNARYALEYYQESVMYRDSIARDENKRAAIRQEYRYAYDQQALADSLAHATELAVKAEEVRRQKVVRNGFMGGFALVAVFAVVFLFQRNRIGKEKERSEELLLNILPEEVAEELKEKGEANARRIDQATVLFTDFKGFTAYSENLSPEQLVHDLNECFTAFDNIIARHGMEKIKTIGDAYMAAGGLPVANDSHAVDAVQAALEIRDFIAEGKARKLAAGLPYFEVRIGLHTGPVVAGIVGVKKFSYDIWGDTVNTASRMESSGEVGQVNISGATYELVRNEPDLTFTPRGKVQAKGKGEMEMYFVHRPA